MTPLFLATPPSPVRGPPLRPGPPLPFRRTLWPSFTPAGIRTFTSRGRRMMPAPLHTSHGSSTNDVSYNIDGSSVNWPGGGGGVEEERVVVRAAAHARHSNVPRRQQCQHPATDTDDRGQQNKVGHVALVCRIVSLVREKAQHRIARAQLDRLLDPDNGSATIESLQRAAKIVGRELRMELG